MSRRFYVGGWRDAYFFFSNKLKLTVLQREHKHLTYAIMTWKSHHATKKKKKINKRRVCCLLKAINCSFKPQFWILTAGAAKRLTFALIEYDVNNREYFWLYLLFFLKLVCSPTLLSVCWSNRLARICLIANLHHNYIQYVYEYISIKHKSEGEQKWSGEDVYASQQTLETHT